MRVIVDFSWHEAGGLSLSAGRLVFPSAPAVPGIYRFDLGDRVYIGETDQLKRLFQGYRTPGVSQATNIRLNAALTSLLSGGRQASAATVTNAVVDVDGRRAPLDLTYKAARLLVESAALAPIVHEIARVAGRGLVESDRARRR
jgi:hypothetical protein